MSLSDTEARAVAAVNKGFTEGFIHPGDEDKQMPPVAIPSPFRTGGLAPELTTHIEATAKLMAEAIVHTIADEVVMVDKAAYAKLTDTEHPPTPQGRVTVYCRCGDPLTRLVVNDSNVATVDGPTFTSELEGHTCRT